MGEVDALRDHLTRLATASANFTIRAPRELEPLTQHGDLERSSFSRIDELKKTSSSNGSLRSDGNSFYRAVMLSYIELLLPMKQHFAFFVEQ